MSARKPGEGEDAAGKVPQGGGELSGLLRHAEVLQRDLDKALADLRNEFVDGRDAAKLIQLRISGDGSVVEAQVAQLAIPERDRKTLEEAVSVAVKSALVRLFEVRRQRATTVTKGLTLPGLFT
jgi:DNA-binding protein YbaB